ncbi:MAG TPA: DUF1998 domain-containing protein [Thermoanaerobaculia bacterium]|nr:DUF1998 domain-containing protein [Thermoanaerobaculia bacterium]
MIASHLLRKSEVGELRPSQLLTTFGVGSLIDLPNLSVLVMGLEDWQATHAIEIGESRLLRSVQRALGSQVAKLLTPPRGPEVVGRVNWFDEGHQIGVPVAPFPRWMVCSKCRLLAPISSGFFNPQQPAYRPHQTRYVHTNCPKPGKPPTVVPARFLMACEKGHLDDFPWVEYVHRGQAGCMGPLELYEVGASGEASDIEVHCRTCDKKRRMAEAFGKDNQENLPACGGRRPHLRDRQNGGCDVPHMRAMLQGASGLWYSVMLSVLSVPALKGEALALLVEEEWATLEKATSREVLNAFRQIGQLKAFAKYSDDELWAAIEKHRKDRSEDNAIPTDLKAPEWQVFSNPSAAASARDLKLRPVAPPPAFVHQIERVVIVDTLREVRALIGFTRIQSPRDFDSPLDLPESHRAPLSRQHPTWVPASETLGEGIFVQFSEVAIREWVGSNAAKQREDDLRSSYERWRTKHNLDPLIGFPGMRYVLLHSFSHALIRGLAMDCGYTTASLAERIYCSGPGEGGPTAGILIYTSAPDSEGTLGGLAALGAPQRLGALLLQALERARNCSSDPLCAEHHSTTDDSLHAAACHACLFLPETSCERGNKFLDRAALVATVEQQDLAFFPS